MIIVIISINEHKRPHFVLVPLLYYKDIVFVMVVSIKVSDVELAIIKYDKYWISFIKLAQ